MSIQNSFKLLLASAPLLIVTSPSIVAAQFTGAPDAISFQGYLTDDADNPIDGIEDVTVRLFNSATLGDLRWERTYLSVFFTDGVFDVTLQEGTPSFGVVNFDEALWVEIEIDEEVITPRTRLASAPYALSLRNLRVQPFSQGDGPNLIGGYLENTVSTGVVGGTISGGGQDGSDGPGPNEVTGDYGSIGGGVGHLAGLMATVGGGAHNDASGELSVIGGGEENWTTKTHGTIGGGYSNKTDGSYATIAGGDNHLAAGSWSTIGGGDENEVLGYYGTIGGGAFNHAEGQFGTVPGGRTNRADGDYSFAAGNRARVRGAIEVGNATGDEGTFIWADRSNPTVFFSSTGSNQFLIQSAGGVGIDTNDPASQLHVAKANGGANGVIVEATEGDRVHFYWVSDQNLTIDTFRGSDSRRLPISFQPNGGNVGIGTTTPSERLQVNGNVLANNVAVPSDARYKNNISPLAGSLEQLSSLRGVSYSFDGEAFPEKGFDSGTHMGLIAQEVREVFPDLVNESESGYLSVNYMEMIPVLLEAIKELKTRVLTLEASQGTD